jgi:FkbM family methyltransferase
VLALRSGKVLKWRDPRMAGRYTVVDIKQVKMKGQSFLVAGGPRGAFWDMVSAGKWEAATLDAIAAFLQQDSTYIDIGAWVGPTVLPAARIASRVLAYEPDPVAADELQANLDYNGLRNVEVRRIALSDHDGELLFGTGLDNEFGNSTSTSMYGERTLSVESRDVLGEANASDFQNCNLLKIDVEGSEYIVVPRLAAYLRRKRPALLLSTHGPAFIGRSSTGWEIRDKLLTRARYVAARVRLFRAVPSYKFAYHVEHGRKEWTRLNKWTLLREVFNRRNAEYLFADEPFAMRPLPLST